LHWPAPRARAGWFAVRRPVVARAFLFGLGGLLFGEVRDFLRERLDEPALFLQNFVGIFLHLLELLHLPLQLFKLVGFPARAGPTRKRTLTKSKYISSVS